MIALEEDLRPNWATLAAGCVAISVVSAALLSWPVAVASTVLGGLMLAGADVDARTFLLPDVVTWGTAGCGILAAAALNQINPWLASATAFSRAIVTALVLALLRWCYARLRECEGLGFGDIKLAAAVGACLPLKAIPLCFGLAAGGAAIRALAWGNDRRIDENSIRRLPMSGAVAGVLRRRAAAVTTIAVWQDAHLRLEVEESSSGTPHSGKWGER